MQKLVDHDVCLGDRRMIGAFGPAFERTACDQATRSFNIGRRQYQHQPAVYMGNKVPLCTGLALPLDPIMCRNIKTLFNFDPPATTDEVNASALQFVRKLSGMNKPSRANEEAFEVAVERVAAAAQEMLNSLETNAPPRDRQVEAARAKERSAIRFGSR